MKSIETSIVITATPQRIWHELMDFESYGDWNPFVLSVQGNANVGESISVELKPPGKDTMQFKPTVLVCNPFQEFRWLGHLFVKGIFDGEHYFRLEPISDGQTKLVHGERFTGFLASALLKMIGENTTKGFVAMNEGLKKRVENI